MRRVVVAALVAAAGCGELADLEAGPLDRFYYPTGVAFTAGPTPGAGALLVGSSNFDLRYETETGGSVIAVSPGAPAAVRGALNVQSLGGLLAVADPARPPEMGRCDALDGAVALLPVRGANLLYRLGVSPEGALSCAGCTIPLGGTSRVDPYSVGVACGPGLARAYVGYLRTTGLAEITQVDLTLDPSADGAVQHFARDGGLQARAFAYDPALQRLYATHSVTGDATTLRWVDLGVRSPCPTPEDPARLCPCRVDQTFPAGGCPTGTTAAFPRGVELRGIALASCLSRPAGDAATCRSAPLRRAYLTVRVYDAAAAAAAGFRVGDLDGKLLVVDLVETLDGNVDVELVREIDLGYGAGDVVVLPPTAAGRRDVVAALATDSARLTIYDDETGAVSTIGADLERAPGDPATGAPLLGHVPTALTVDPVRAAGDPARLYVASFQDSWVTPVRVDIPDAGPATACLVGPEGACVTDPWLAHRIGPGVAP